MAITPQAQMQYFDFEIKEWKPLPAMAQLTEANASFCAEYVGNHLYVAGKKGDILFRIDMIPLIISGKRYRLF